MNRILGGAELNVVDLVEHWDRTGSSFLPSLAVPKDSPLRARLEPLGIPIQDHGFGEAMNGWRFTGGKVDWTRGFRALRALREAQGRLARFLEQTRPDGIVTVTHKDHFCAAPVARRLGIPHVWWINDLLTRDFFPGSIRAAFAWQAWRHVGYWVPVSEACSDALKVLGVPGSRIRKIHNGIPLESFPMIPRGNRDDQQVLQVGYAGRLTPWKGAELFLQVAAEMEIRHPGAAHFSLIGGVHHEDQAFAEGLKRLVAEMGLESRVTFLGFQESMTEVLSGLAVLLHTAIRPEPFGRVVVESMAVGTPVVGPSQGGVPEILEPGRTGWLVPPGRPEGYVRALEELLREPQLGTRFSENGRLACEERFSMERCAGDWENLLQEILAA